MEILMYFVVYEIVSTLGLLAAALIIRKHYRAGSSFALKLQERFRFLAGLEDTLWQQRRTDQAVTLMKDRLDNEIKNRKILKRRLERHALHGVVVRRGGY